jgi:hypothetical protein
VQALVGALASMLCAVTGITNKSLRLDDWPARHPYGINQASYEFGRLARNGLITRTPHRNLCALTPTACDSRSSAPRSTTGCCARSRLATSPRSRPPSGKPSIPSTAKSLCASQQPACRPLHDLQQPNQAWKLKTVVKVGLTKRG